MSKKRWGIVIAIFIVVILVAYIYINAFTLLFLPKGKLINISESPNKTYTFKSYLVNAGGATGSFAIRGEVKNNKKGSTRTIYWEYKVDKARIEWVDDHTILINGRQLDVTKDSYDFRRHR